MGAESRERIARNFIARHGRRGLARLLDLLASGDSGQEIAAEFDVSRERVRQWKNTFGQSVTFYQVHPDVRRMLDEAE